jgi:Flp pilus assembly protein TadG
MRNLLGRFQSSERGNVLITFALLLVPLIGFVGAAVDYSRGNSSKAAMQAAVDATALMLSKDIGKTAAPISTPKPPPISMRCSIERMCRIS